jgi:hypothetical protein
MARYRINYDDDGSTMVSPETPVTPKTPTTFEQRLAMVLRMMFAAPTEGERQSAFQSASKMLQSGNGKDIHWLVERVDPPKANGAKAPVTYSEAEAMEIYGLGVKKGRQEAVARQQAAGDEYRNLDGTMSLHGMALFLLDRIGGIPEKHHDFLRKVAGLTAAGCQLTIKRENYLRSLYFENGGTP